MFPLLAAPFQEVQDATYTILLFEFALFVLMYYISKIISNTELVKWSKQAIINVFITALMALLILNGVLPFLNKLSETLATEVLTTQYPNLANDFSFQGSNYDLTDVVLMMMKQGPFACLIKTRNFMYLLYEFFFNSAPAKISYKYLEATGSGTGIYDMMFQNLFAQIVFYEVMYFLLYKILVLFKYFLFPLMFPVGVALRGFRPSRSLGAFFMALSLSFYIVFPFVYLFSMMLFPSISKCAPQIVSFDDKCSMLDPSYGDYTSLEAAKQFFSLGWEFISSSFKEGFEEFFRSVALAFCLYPFLAFSFAATTTNIGTTLFGGRIPEIGRGLIKFI